MAKMQHTLDVMSYQQKERDSNSNINRDMVMLVVLVVMIQVQIFKSVYICKNNGFFEFYTVVSISQKIL